ncbi:MAG: threonylcarbamoyl-AMP synthase [Lachnospiraceae bacterium]|nr:threonylcarbamoyl-AMP synthase [Lachnospiraceae bacterium]
METRIVRINYTKENEPDPASEKAIAEAGRILKEGGLVAFPTETVYGLGGDAFNPESSRRIYQAKGRPSDNPLIVHIADIGDLPELSDRIPKEAYLLSDRFWPGPLTMILPKKDRVPKETTGGLDTVAIRFPSNPAAKALIREGGGFIAAPSANRSGRPSPTSAKYVIEDLSGRVDVILDGGDCVIGLESTIVDLTSEIPTVLRPGGVTLEELREVLGDVEIDRALIKDDSGIAPKAPGMKYRHYAPKGDLTVVRGEKAAVERYINGEIEKARNTPGHHIITAVIASTETASSYRADIIKNIGAREDENAIARNLFRILRECDDEGAGRIFAESFAGPGLKEAVMNRLLKAAGHKEITV